ncbi:HlyD family efflux transporter periplasmic adaptor subunit [bacterium]|nr:HlyD family efflux transporter periplasmic adaptor subunit [bacterium]
MVDTLISPPEPTPDESPHLADSPQQTQSLTSRLANTSQKVMFDFIIPAGLLVGGIAALILLGTAETEKRPGPGTDYDTRLEALSEVRVERLRTLTSLGEQLELIVDGSVAPFREVQVATEVSGEIIEKLPICEAGAYVEAGTPLMKIDTTDYDFEVDRFTQIKAQEYQALREVEQEKDNIRRSIEIAKEDMSLQQREVDRQMQLGDGFTSPAERDKARRALLAARQQLVTLENQLSLLEERRLKIVVSEKLAETQLLKAENDLKRTEICAPISGVIVNENVDLHSFVARGTTLVTIDDTSKAEVATSLRMDQLYWVLNQAKESPGDISNETTAAQNSTTEPGKKADSRGYSLPETKAIIEYELAGREGVKYYWNAKLMSYDGIGLDSATRTVPVRVVVDAPNQHVDAKGASREVNGATALVRGMYVRVKLLIKPRPEWMVIPARGLQVDNRILQFSPDPSVLAVESDESDRGRATTTQTKSADGDQPTKFTAQEWIPGKVTLAPGINPIAPLSGSTNLETKGDNASSFSRKNQRLWVCEIAGASAELLKQNPFVVVSPFEEINDQASSPARASAAVVKSAERSNATKKQVSRLTTAGQES